MYLAQSSLAGLKLRILLSYHYYKKINLDELFEKYFDKPYPDVFADSGAFSAWSQGASISIDEYINWIEKWKHLFAVYSNLDVIGDSVKTYKNQEHMEKAGLFPLPVFHAGSNYKHLEELVEKYPYIALGGLVPYLGDKNKVMPHFIKCFRIADKKSVFHGFGVTSWYAISSLPWYSVDSSSWGTGFRFGRVPIFDSKNGNFKKLKLGDFKQWKKHSALVKRLGFNWMDFADRKRNDRAKIAAISALSYMLAEQYLRKIHGEIRIPNRQGKPEALRVYLANTDPARYNDAVTGIRIYLADASNGINYSSAQKGVNIYLSEAGNDILKTSDLLKQKTQFRS